jgi:hypothetical protein
MASNAVEVLEPAATVESGTEPGQQSESAVSRRSFMAALGVAGAVGMATLVSAPPAAAQQPVGNGYDPIDVLNFLLNIKYLQATLYSFLTQGKDLPPASNVTVGTGVVYNQPAQLTITGTNAQQITDMLNEMYYDELEQLIAFRSFLGAVAVNRGTINLLGTSAANTTFAAPATTTVLTTSQAIALARLLEDVSVQAFAGAAPYLSGTYLSLAMEAMAVDGFHAGAIRLAAIQTGAAYQGTELLTSFQIGTNSGSATVYAILGSVVPTVGATLSGGGIPEGTLITAVSSKASVTPTGIVTKSSPTITSVSSVAGVAVGQPVTGANIPALTYVTAVGTNTITMSQAATATITTAETITIGQSTITISQAATATASSTAIVAAGDPYGFDVLPADIGVGAASTGPIAVPSSSPTVYQGFFDTAGSATSSGSSPAGFVFARNFSQVLAVLYGNSTAGTYEGGFFPVGAAGHITVV